MTEANDDAANNPQPEAQEQHDEDESPKSSPRGKARDVYHYELEKLRESMQREKSKLHPPPKKEYTPDVYNNLGPFFDLKTFEQLVDSPRDPKHGYASRWTASTLVDPWIAYRMDATKLPEIEPQPAKTKPSPRKKNDGNKDQRKEGSTRLPQWPVVNIRMKKQDRQLTFTDVPRLRKELREKYTSNAQEKIDRDYTRTQQDFYRMKLDKLDEVPSETNKKNLCLAYHAYLRNTTGSGKALVACIRAIRGHKEERQQEENSEQEKHDEPEKPAEEPAEQPAEAQPAQDENTAA